MLEEWTIGTDWFDLHILESIIELVCVELGSLLQQFCLVYSNRGVTISKNVRGYLMIKCEDLIKRYPKHEKLEERCLKMN